VCSARAAREKTGHAKPLDRAVEGDETRLSGSGAARPTESRDRRQAFGSKTFSEICSFGWNLSRHTKGASQNKFFVYRFFRPHGSCISEFGHEVIS